MEEKIVIREKIHGKDMIIILCMILFSVLCAALSWTVVEKFSQPVTVVLDGKIMNSPFEGDVKDFVLLADRFARQHEYNSSGYNCVNYSKDLHVIAEELGFSTRLVRGCTLDPELFGNASECHAFLKLEVDFEPQSGEFLDYSKEYPYQEEWS